MYTICSCFVHSILSVVGIGVRCTQGSNFEGLNVVISVFIFPPFLFQKKRNEKESGEICVLILHLMNLLDQCS